MAGDVINLTYYENSDLLQSAIVTGGAALRIAGEKGAAESVLHAENIEIGMAPDGTTLTSLNAQGPRRARSVRGQGTAVEESDRRMRSSPAAKREGADGGVVHRRREYRETGARRRSSAP